MTRKLSLLILLILLTMAGLWAFGQEVLKIEPLARGKSVMLRFQLQPGYGVQKAANNELMVYELKNGHEKQKNIRLKIKEYGTLLGETTVFRGRTSAKDKDYFDTLQESSIKLKKTSTSQLALGGKIYYCSFADKFCSVQSISQLITDY